jgi:hypothetical protein
MPGYHGLSDAVGDGRDDGFIVHLLSVVAGLGNDSDGCGDALAAGGFDLDGEGNAPAASGVAEHSLQGTPPPHPRRD